MKFIILICLAITGVIKADLITDPDYHLNVSDQGFYYSSGYHNSSDIRPYAGTYGAQANNFFVFDLSSVTEEIINAVIQLDTKDLTQGGVFTLYEVTTSIDNIRAGGTGLISIYDDLGQGTVLGTASILDTADGSVIQIQIDNSYLDSLNAARISGDRNWAIGGSYASSGYAFGVPYNEFSGAPPPVLGDFSNNQLLLQTIPEPTATALIAISSGLFFAGRRIFRRKKDKDQYETFDLPVDLK